MINRKKSCNLFALCGREKVEKKKKVIFIIRKLSFHFSLSRLHSPWPEEWKSNDLCLSVTKVTFWINIWRSSPKHKCETEHQFWLKTFQQNFFFSEEFSQRRVFLMWQQMARSTKINEEVAKKVRKTTADYANKIVRAMAQAKRIKSLAKHKFIFEFEIQLFGDASKARKSMTECETLYRMHSMENKNKNILLNLQARGEEQKSKVQKHISTNMKSTLFNCELIFHRILTERRKKMYRILLKQNNRPTNTLLADDKIHKTLRKIMFAKMLKFSSQIKCKHRFVTREKICRNTFKRIAVHCKRQQETNSNEWTAKNFALLLFHSHAIFLSRFLSFMTVFSDAVRCLFV